MRCDYHYSPMVFESYCLGEEHRRESGDSAAPTRTPIHLGAWGVWLNESGRPDLNRGPPAPEAGALTGLRYAPSLLQQRKRDKNKRKR